MLLIHFARSAIIGPQLLVWIEDVPTNVKFILLTVLKLPSKKFTEYHSQKKKNYWILINIFKIKQIVKKNISNLIRNYLVNII